MPRERRLLRPDQLLITCEHGGNRVPARYRRAFAHAGPALASHRGYDRGALELARELSRCLHAALVYSTISRLLIELNRSLSHRHAFSPYARRLPIPLREELVARYYMPYRRAVEQQITRAVRRGRRMVHLSSHSFTPRRAGVLRTVDIGLLYDPHRSAEAAFCARWRQLLIARDARLRVRRNYPYRGSADGLTTALRRQFPERAYLGIELEVNQRFVRAGGDAWRELRALLVDTFAEALRAR